MQLALCLSEGTSAQKLIHPWMNPGPQSGTGGRHIACVQLTLVPWHRGEAYEPSPCRSLSYTGVVQATPRGAGRTGSRAWV